MLPCLFDTNTKYKYKSYQAHVNTQIQLKIISISILRLLLLLSRTHASPVDEASGNVGEQYFFSLIVYFLSSIKCISSFLLDRLFQRYQMYFYCLVQCLYFVLFSAFLSYTMYLSSFMCMSFVVLSAQYISLAKILHQMYLFSSYDI